MSASGPLGPLVYAPAMIMAGALSVIPVRPSVRMYVRTILTYVRLSRQCSLSKSNTIDQNFMKLGHIV